MAAVFSSPRVRDLVARFERGPSPLAALAAPAASVAATGNRAGNVRRLVALFEAAGPAGSTSRAARVPPVAAAAAPAVLAAPQEDAGALLAAALGMGILQVAVGAYEDVPAPAPVAAPRAPLPAPAAPAGGRGVAAVVGAFAAVAGALGSAFLSLFQVRLPVGQGVVMGSFDMGTWLHQAAQVTAGHPATFEACPTAARELPPAHPHPPWPVPLAEQACTGPRPPPDGPPLPTACTARSPPGQQGAQGETTSRAHTKVQA